MTVPMDQPWEKWNSHRPRLKIDQSDTKGSARLGISEDYNHEGTVGSVRAEHDGRAWLPRDVRAQDFDNERPQMIKGSPPSLPASGITRSSTGASGRRRHLFGTPEPGERPLSDAIVPPERLLREGSTARREARATESGGERRGGGEGSISSARDGVVSNSDFESDVRRAMNDLERQLASGDSVGIGERGRRYSEGTDGRDTRLVPAMSSFDANLESRDSPHVLMGERAGLFSVETNPKRLSSDVDNVYISGGEASGTRSTADAGVALPSSADLPRQDWESEKMAMRDETVLGPFRSQRSGPGLRNLWSGPDTAAEDRAKNSAKAAYLRALERDEQLRRAIASDDKETGVRETRRVSRGPSSPSQRSIGSDPADARRVESVATGPHSGRKTPRQRAPWDGGEEIGRLDEKAKKAAYAQALRRQIAEKEARKVKEEGEHGGIRRRLSAGQFESASVGGLAQESIENDRQNRFIERSSSLSGATGGGLVLTSHHGDSARAAPEVHHDLHDDPVERFEDSMANGILHSVSATSARDPIPVERPSSTTARRRLVEDVYGRARVSSALGNAEQRLGSPGGREDRGAGIIRGNRVGDGDGDSVFVGAARSFLRTGAGMQSLTQSEPEDRLQRRAAALEQQRALREQIAEKAKLKGEEEAKRKLEEEEEARQQREYLLRVEAEAEEEKLRRQAKQQEQLEAMYRQQQEALQKKRGGSIDSGGVRRLSDSGTPRDRSRQVMDRGFDAGQTKSPGSEQAGQGSPAADETTLGNDPVALRTARSQSSGIKLDIDDLPAGAHARAEVLRGVPSRGKGESPPLENPGPREQHGDKGLGSDEHRMEAPPASARGFIKDEDRVAHASTEHGVVGREPRHRGSALRASESRFHLGGDKGANGTPGRQESVGILPSQDVEPPLRNHSTLLPISSTTLFPSDPVEAPRLAAALHGASGGYTPRRRRSIHVDRPVAVKGRARSSIGVSEWSRDTAEGCRSGDEIDALVTSWNTNPSRGRAVQSPLIRVGGNVDESRAAGSYAGSPNLAISSSPRPRARPHDSRAREHNRSSDGSLVSQEDILGESMGSTSRQMSIRMPPIQSAIIPGSKRHPRRGTTSAAEHGPDASEQSLTSDSVLYYLADSHRERTSEPSASVTAGGSLLTADKAAPTRRRRRWGRDCGTAPPAGAPPLRSPLAEKEGDRGGDDHEETSPLTRLLAQIDVRLGDCKLHTPSKDVEPVASSGDLRRWSKRTPSEPTGDTCMMPIASGLDGAFSLSSSRIHLGGVGGKNVPASPRTIQARKSCDTRLTSSHASRRDLAHGLGRRLSGRNESRDFEVLKTSSATERSGSGSSGGGCLAGSRNSRALWESHDGSNAKIHALSSREGGVRPGGNA